jgi:hypothetical protein
VGGEAVQICLKQSGLWISKTGMEKQFPVQFFKENGALLS